MARDHSRGWNRRLAVYYLMPLVVVLIPSTGFNISRQRPRTASYPLRRLATPSRDEDQEPEPQRFNALESPVDDERRPRRLESLPIQEQAIYPWNDWGVEQKESPNPVFPFSVDKVTTAAWEAIAATLYNKQKLDPNFVQNIFRGDTVHGRRPVRSAKDAGRIGIELDGASCLFQGESNARATRLVSLKLAGKLSQSPWEGYEPSKSNKNRPVVVYFNTIKQALTASHELQLLKRIEQENSAHNDDSTTCYDNVKILCLGQESGLPRELIKKRPANQKKVDSLSAGTVDPTRGLLLVVQPSDYNAEYRPPGPSVGTVEAFQRLVACAAVAEIPTVILSPRFLANEIPYAGSWEQSGYQQSAVYGGIEPPRGPTPWVMRDFSPPIFSWVGCALPLPLRRTNEFRNDKGDVCHYSRVSLMQSVLDEGHSWHAFASRECEHGGSRSGGGTTWTTIDHDYMASTKSASGRPTRDVMWRLFGEFAPY